MAKELAYVWITPYSLVKSRTGGIIARLGARTQPLELVGVRMFAPSNAMIDEYQGTIDGSDEEKPEIRQLLKTYLDQNLRPGNRRGIVNRALLLLFSGDDAIAKLREVIGSFSRASMHGDTIRGTYGDYVTFGDGQPHYFEPCVLSADTVETCRRQLAIFAKYADADGGVLERVIPFKPEEQSQVQTTLVILKPENFMKPSARPGNIIDTFSRTGLYIVGTKILRMSVAQAREFYGPLRAMFVDKLRFLVEKRIVQSLLPALGFPVTGDQVARMADLLKEDNADCEFNKIIEFMTGRHPREVKSPAEAAAPGPSKCLALLYQGVNAIEKIREALGSTDPNKAESGTVRSDYGADLMRNGAHASDSAENAARERRIIGLAGGEPAQIVPIIREYLGA